MSIRSTAKAIIVNNNKILLNKCFDENNGIIIHYQVKENIPMKLFKIIESC